MQALLISEENLFTRMVYFAASKLKALLEKRKWSVNKPQGKVQSNDDSILVEDMANLLHENDLFTKQLEGQIGVYQVKISLSNC